MKNRTAEKNGTYSNCIY